MKGRKIAVIDFKEIRIFIRKKYKNESDFAKKDNISKSKLSLLLNGKASMSMEMADFLIKDLGIPTDKIQPIFFKS